MILLEISGYQNELSLRTALKRNTREFANTLNEYAQMILSEDYPFPELRETFKMDLETCFINCHPAKCRIPPGHIDFLIGTFGTPLESQEESKTAEQIYSDQNYQTKKRKLEPEVQIFGDDPETLENDLYFTENDDKKMKMIEEEIYEDESQISQEFDAAEIGGGTEKQQLGLEEEHVSFFTEKNKKRLVLLLRKCWPKEIDIPEFFIIEEVGPKSWTVQCPQCENHLKIFLNTAGGYLRFNKANFQRHLAIHSKGLSKISCE